MKHLLILCFLSLSFTSLYASIVEDMCKNATASKERYDFCITSFQAVPKSHTADKYELAVIGLELSLANHTYNLAKAKELRQQPQWSNQTKQSIDVCIDVYASSLTDLNKAVENAKKKWSFNADISSAGILVNTCQQAFQEIGEKDLLATENSNAFILDCIMGAVDALLHPQEWMNFIVLIKSE